MKQQENNLIYSAESEYKFVFNIILIATPILSSFIVGLFLRIPFAFISFEWKIPSGNVLYYKSAITELSTDLFFIKILLRRWGRKFLVLVSFVFRM